MKAPLRFLTRARDIYVQGMIQCSGHFAYPEAPLGCPTGQLPPLSRSFSVDSAPRDDDFKDLVRATSLRSHNNSVEFSDAVVKMPRSRRPGITRIDEDKPCEYFGDDSVDRENLLVTTCGVLKVLFRSFELVSELKVNFHKSKLYGLHATRDFMHTAAQFLECK
ncbi:hypothetical protein VNO77_25142 [Canavalia gladiata]|uniref:Uncharacterized protein n=1 Tax=Canavalia gladiata TaxID=3824 RepID=A0AAN9QD76_CANGL